MLRKRGKKGQAVSSEYAITYVIVVAAILTTGVYLKRAIQARFYDIRNYMVEQIQKKGREAGSEYDRSQTWGPLASFNGKIWLHYEPYYAIAEATKTKEAYRNDQILAGISSGIYITDRDIDKGMILNTEQRPPKEADMDRSYLGFQRYWDQDRYLENNN